VTRQELEFFEVKGRKYTPDLLVVSWVLNDCWPAETLFNELERIKQEEAANGSDPASGGSAPPAPAPNAGETAKAAPPGEGTAPAADRVASTLLERSRLVELVRDRVGRATARRPGLWLPLEQICAIPQNWKLVSRSFAELAKIAARDRFSVAVVIFPMLVDFEHYPYHRLHQRVAQEARRNGFPVLDLFEAFEPHSADELQLLPGDTTHPGALGHLDQRRLGRRGLRRRPCPAALQRQHLDRPLALGHRLPGGGLGRWRLRCLDRRVRRRDLSLRHPLTDINSGVGRRLLARGRKVLRHRARPR